MTISIARHDGKGPESLPSAEPDMCATATPKMRLLHFYPTCQYSNSCLDDHIFSESFASEIKYFAY